MLTSDFVSMSQVTSIAAINALVSHLVRALGVSTAVISSILPSSMILLSSSENNGHSNTYKTCVLHLSK